MKLLRRPSWLLGFLPLVVVFFTLQIHAGEKPNILFILTDDQGYGDMSAHGHPLLETPHLDRLRSESVRFESFYVSPSCSPTRAALLTGMHEFRNGVTHTVSPRESLNPKATILPELLKTEGYKTGFIGKWHLGNKGEHAPQERGFDISITNVGAAKVHFDPIMVRNGKRNQEKGYREDIFFDEAIRFMNESAEQPFFCYLATYSPHAPLDAPKQFVEPFLGKVSANEAKYLGMIANLDYNVGRIMKHLKDSGLEKNTMVVFMNDNGVTHGLDVYNAGMRGPKCTIWQGGSRAMSFWRWPEKWQPKAVHALTAHLDVLPTFCHYAGVKIPGDLQRKLEGFSLKPLLENESESKWEHADRLLFRHVARWPGGLAAEHKYAMASVQKGDFLLVQSQECGSPQCKESRSQCTTLRSVAAGKKRGPYTRRNAQFHWGVTPQKEWTLFNLKTDQKCRNDLAAEMPELLAELADAYEIWWAEVFPEIIAQGGSQETEKDEE